MTAADSLFEYLIGVFPPGRAYTRAQFERSPMPPLVAHYLAQALHDRLAAEIEQTRPNLSDWFDAAHPEVEAAFDDFTAAAMRHARIPADEWKPALRKAVDEVTAFLVSPAGTLTGHVFEDHDGPLPAPVVRRRLGYFAAHGYFREVVDAYFEQRNVEQIDRSRFNALLARIDHQMTDGYTAEDWVRLLDPLYELMHALPGAPDVVAIPLLRTFFAEKGAEEITRKLLEAHEREGRQALGKAELLQLIEAASAVPVKAPPPPLPSAPVRQAPPPVAPVAEEEPQPLWKRFQRGEYAPPSPYEAPYETPPPPVATPLKPRPIPPLAPTAPFSPPAREHIPLWRRFQSPAASPTPAPPAAGTATDLATLESNVLGDRGRRNRDLFIKHLFGGSVENYARALHLLHQAPNWTQASQIIAQEVFLRHQVNIYSEPAVAFTDAVEARFRG